MTTKTQRQQTNPLHLENTVLHLGRRDLAVQNCFKTYRDMKLDPVIGGSLSFIKALISKTPYKIKAARGSTAKQKELVKALNDSLGNTTYGRKRLIDNFLTCLDYGASLSEVVLEKNAQGFWVFKNISPIHLSTVNRFTFEKGTLIKAEIIPAENDGLIMNKDVDIKDVDGKKLLLIRLESDSDFPMGKSLLYGCYTAWKTKSILQEYTTIGAAKNLSTVVKVKLPMEYINAYMEDPTSPEAQYTDELLSSIENLHAGKSCYAVVPSDLSSGGQSLFDIVPLANESASSFNAETTIERYNREILFNLQTSVLALGSNSQGSFSLAENSTNLLGLFIENIFATIAEEFLSALRLAWEANGFDIAKLPSLEFGDIDQKSLENFADSWSKLITSGAVTVDKSTEAKIREDFGMPEIEETKQVEVK